MSHEVGLHLSDRVCHVTALPAARWEWRIFGDSFRLRAQPFMVGVRFAIPCETHIIGANCVHDIRVTDEHLIVRELMRAAETGLQLWRTTRLDPFPLTSAAVRHVCGLLGVPAPTRSSEKYDETRLFSDVLGGVSRIRAVSVAKRPVPMRVLGCHGEHAELLVDGTPLETIAVVDEDADRLLAAVAELGLSPEANSSYPNALARMGRVPVPPHFFSRSIPSAKRT